jgi:hypothetical protein
VYHLELRQFPHVARVFNLSRDELDGRFLRPWNAGTMVEADDRRWVPERTRLKVLEGPALRSEDLGLGRGWASVTRRCEDVTEAVLAEAERGARARPEVEALKDAVAESAGGALGFDDVMALAAAAHPSWRASEQLELAEQAVWEMLHQGRLRMHAAGREVDRERWQAVVLSWQTWTGAGAERVSLRAAEGPPPGPSGAPPATR